MMRSLYSGVAGLKTHQTKMDVIGNNIANVNTTSFKSQSITFSDLMYQTTQSASGATATRGGVNARQIGLGAKSGAINTAIESQGATQTTNNPFDIMITGKSFFVVSNGKEKLYTRDGSFYIDGAGNLAMQSNGYFVQGWNATEDPETGEITVNKNGELSQLQIMSADNTTYSPASTTAALYSGNIDDNDTNVVSDDGKTVTLEFYDNKGYLYTAKFNIKDTEDPDDHLFSLQLTDILDSDGKSIGTKRLAGVTFGDDTIGTQVSPPSTSDFEIEPVDGDNGIVYKKAGTPLYNGAEIPKDTSSLTLIDLLSSKYSKQKYAGVLNQVYGVSDDNILNGTINGTKVDGLSKTDGFTVDPDTGDLIVTLDIKEDKILSQTNPDYSYIKNTYNYYVNSTTSKGYKAIDETTGGEMPSASKLTASTLVNVFGLSQADADTYTNADNGFVYSYTVDSSGVGTLKIFNKVNLKEAPTFTNTNATAMSALSDKFTGSTGYTTIEDALSGMDPLESLTYTYNNGKLTIKHVQDKVPAEYAEGVRARDESAADGFAPASTPFSLNQFNSLANIVAGSNAGVIVGSTIHMQKYYDDLGIAGKGIDTLFAEYAGTEDVSDFQSVLDDLPAGTVAFSFHELSGTGTQGYLLYDHNYVQEDATIYEGELTAVVNKEEDTSFVKSTGGNDEYPFVLKNNTDNSVYVITGKEKVVLDYSEELLSTVFQVNRSDYDKNDSEGNQIQYAVSLSSNGMTITHTEPYTIPIDSENYYIEEGDNGGIVYKTKKRMNAYGTDSEGNDITVPLSGDIKDILKTSDKPYAGALMDLYGISDSNARAYGDDGKYTIDQSGNITLKNGSQSIQLVFDAATGKIVSANGKGTLGNSEQKVNLTFDQDVEGNEAFGFQVLNENDEDEVARRGTIEIDFSTVTNYNTNGSSTIKVVKGDKKSLNTGRAVGEMNGVTVSTDGTIYATYSNGQTKLLGQIASAQFANASGLSKEGDNLYKQTLNSGEATIQDITTDGGYMNTGVLEMSNVDLSSQFTEMITTQRGFQANSRIITVSDTLLEELTNLKR